MIRLSALLVLAFALGACDSGIPPAIPIEETTFAPSLNVDLSAMSVTERGVYWRDLEVGEGPQVLGGQRVVVYYQGWLTDGTRFDSRQPPDDQPFRFVLGTGAVIAGWDDGLLRTRIGSTRQLVIPARMAYGTQRRGDIPPNSTLVFEVQVVGIE